MWAAKDLTFGRDPLTFGAYIWFGPCCSSGEVGRFGYGALGGLVDTGGLDSLATSITRNALADPQSTTGLLVN